MLTLRQADLGAGGRNGGVDDLGVVEHGAHIRNGVLLAAAIVAIRGLGAVRSTGSVMVALVLGEDMRHRIQLALDVLLAVDAVAGAHALLRAGRRGHDGDLALKMMGRPLVQREAAQQMVGRSAGGAAVAEQQLAAWIVAAEGLQVRDGCSVIGGGGHAARAALPCAVGGTVLDDVRNIAQAVALVHNPVLRLPAGASGGVSLVLVIDLVLIALMRIAQGILPGIAAAGIRQGRAAHQHAAHSYQQENNQMCSLLHVSSHFPFLRPLDSLGVFPVSSGTTHPPPPGTRHADQTAG